MKNPDSETPILELPPREILLDEDILRFWIYLITTDNISFNEVLVLFKLWPLPNLIKKRGLETREAIRVKKAILACLKAKLDKNKTAHNDAQDIINNGSS